ncbi:MAG: DUF177 domain-containing protein [Chloroflexi bacterium]|nr:DUF177 domain-containing protein [Chloroflexota bacterium]
MKRDTAMMQINVSQLLKEPVGSTRSYEVQGAVNITGGASSEVEGQVELTRTNRGILVRGKLHTEVKVTCSRCLTPFNYPLTLNFEEEYFPAADVFSGAWMPLPEEPGSFTIDEHHILDLSRAIVEYALLSIPMKPLCREDCPGLCPNCGRNLNFGLCACEVVISNKPADKEKGME